MLAFAAIAAPSWRTDSERDDMKKRRYWTGAKRAPAQDKFFIDALDPDLWERGDETDWDACWHTGMPARHVFKGMKPGQWVNHIPGNHALTVKSRLHQILDAARERAPVALQDRYRFFPQSYLMPEHYHALQREAFERPEKRWIIKPKSMSRGRGIEVVADAGAAPVDEKMLVQEYLNAPHLYEGRKYVLRCYLAITSAEPLRVYLYKEGFVKLASEPYRDGDFDNLYAHLTNPDVNALNEAVDTAVEFHSFADYRKWLTENGADPEPIFTALRDIGVIAAIAAREIMRERLDKSGAWAPGCCELIGMDCMVDADLKPWLLECNLSPSLGVCAEPGAGGAMEEDVKRAVVVDLVAMAGLNESARKQIDPDDITAVIAASEREHECAGGFERIYPADDAREFFPFFPAPRYADIALADAICAGAADDYRFAANAAGEYAFDDEIVLHGDSANRLMSPPTAGAYIWLRAGNGDRPGEVARDLVNFSGASDVSEQQALKTVWDTLADWGAAGLLLPAGEAPATPEPRSLPTPPAWAGEQAVRFGGRFYRIRFATPEIEARIDPVTAPIRTAPSNAANAEEITVLADRAGYAISVGARLARANLRLAEIAAALCDVLKNEIAGTDGDAPLLAASLWRIGDRTALIASSAHSRWDCLGAAMLASGDAALIAGACRLGDAPGVATPLPLPARTKIDDADRPPAFIGQWRNERRGAFIPLPALPNGNRSVDGVILPRFQASLDETMTTRLAGRRAFLALASMVEGAAPTSAATRLARWPDAVPCTEIKFGNGPAGGRAIVAAMSVP